MSAQRLLAAAMLPLVLAGCGGGGDFDRQSQIGANPVLPQIRQYLFPPMHLAKTAPWQADQAPTVSNGLQITALARGLDHPRNVYVLPNGDVLAVESDGPGFEGVNRPKDVIMNWIEHRVTGAGSGEPPNRITLLRDTDHDGKADVRTVFLDHLLSPFGVVLVGSDLYVANTDSIVRYAYTPGAAAITTPGTKLTDLPGGPIDHHWTKSLTASPDGTKLYVGIGSNSNVTENGIEAEHDRAMIWEVDRATGAHRPYATGLRNPNGLTFYPGTSTLWTVVNERDELGPDLVPDYLTSVRPGAFYGWPYSYYGQHVDPRVRPQQPDMVAKAIPPDYALSSHVAALGLAFYTGGGSLPGWFNGGAFVGEHGSWDRQRFNGYRVVFVPFRDGRPAGKALTVVTGFLDGKGRARGRPVGVAIDSGGGLLIADDVGGVIWRVTGAPAPARTAQALPARRTG